MDLLRAKFQKYQDARTAHALIEALGLQNTRSASNEIVQVVKTVRPSLYLKEEVSPVYVLYVSVLVSYDFPFYLGGLCVGSNDAAIIV